mmetsp:Transcript_51132/g.108640  ORF Transcript_51132/g.108640 Transcript_51132/m.108640 type:complete len:272 (+) Transcript_51132:394-1209(+)
MPANEQNDQKATPCCLASSNDFLGACCPEESRANLKAPVLLLQQVRLRLFPPPPLRLGPLLLLLENPTEQPTVARPFHPHRATPNEDFDGFSCNFEVGWGLDCPGRLCWAAGAAPGRTPLPCLHQCWAGCCPALLLLAVAVAVVAAVAVVGGGVALVFGGGVAAPADPLLQCGHRVPHWSRKHHRRRLALDGTMFWSSFLLRPSCCCSCYCPRRRPPSCCREGRSGGGCCCWTKHRSFEFCCCCLQRAHRQKDEKPIGTARPPVPYFQPKC